MRAASGRRAWLDLHELTGPWLSAGGLRHAFSRLNFSHPHRSVVGKEDPLECRAPLIPPWRTERQGAFRPSPPCAPGVLLSASLSAPRQAPGRSSPAPRGLSHLLPYTQRTGPLVARPAGCGEHGPQYPRRGPLTAVARNPRQGTDFRQPGCPHRPRLAERHAARRALSRCPATVPAVCCLRSSMAEHPDPGPVRAQGATLVQVQPKALTDASHGAPDGLPGGGPGGPRLPGFHCPQGPCTRLRHGHAPVRPRPEGPFRPP